MSCVRHQLQAGDFLRVWGGLCVGLDPTWDQCVSPHTRGTDHLWMDVGAFGRPQINTFRAGTGFLTRAKSVCVCDVSRCASSSSSASHLLSCLPWCPPETPSADRVWEVPVPGNWQAGPGSASTGAASLHSSSTCFPSLDGPCHSNISGVPRFPDPAVLHWMVPIVPTSLCQRCRRGSKLCPQPGIPSAGSVHPHAASSCPGVPAGCRGGTQEAEPRRGTRLCSSATTTFCKLFFHGKVNCPWWCLG